MEEQVGISIILYPPCNFCHVNYLISSYPLSQTGFLSLKWGQILICNIFWDMSQWYHFDLFSTPHFIWEPVPFCFCYWSRNSWTENPSNYKLDVKTQDHDKQVLEISMWNYFLYWKYFYLLFLLNSLERKKNGKRKEKKNMHVCTSIISKLLSLTSSQALNFFHKWITFTHLPQIYWFIDLLIFISLPVVGYLPSEGCKEFIKLFYAFVCQQHKESNVLIRFLTHILLTWSWYGFPFSVQLCITWWFL